MATITGTRTVDGVLVINATGDPTLGIGVVPRGSLVLAADGAGIYYKFGNLATDYSKIAFFSSTGANNILYTDSLNSITNSSNFQYDGADVYLNGGHYFYAKGLGATVLGFMALTVGGLKLSGIDINYNTGLCIYGSQNAIYFTHIYSGGLQYITMPLTGAMTFVQGYIMKTGTAAVGGFPAKMVSGTLMVTPEVGALEFVTDDLYFTVTTGSDKRQKLARLFENNASLNFPNTLAQTSSDLTITVTGAAVGDSVSLGIPNGAIVANSTYIAFVSAINTVTVRFNNYSALAINPAGGQFKVIVFKN